MKGTWLLAPALVSALAVGQAPALKTLGDVATPLKRVDAALAQNDVKTAIRAWQDAHHAAQASRRPEDLLAVGHAHRRIGEVAGTPERFDAKARELYLAALFHARQAGSFDGVLQAADAFAALGDREVVGQAVRIAEVLAAQDPDAQAALRAFTVRFAAPLASAHK